MFCAEQQYRRVKGHAQLAALADARADDSDRCLTIMRKKRLSSAPKFNGKPDILRRHLPRIKPNDAVMQLRSCDAER